MLDCNFQRALSAVRKIERADRTNGVVELYNAFSLAQEKTFIQLIGALTGGNLCASVSNMSFVESGMMTSEDDPGISGWQSRWMM